MPPPQSIAVIAGGVGAARMLRGIVAAYPNAAITAIVNVADDEVMHGLAISPDIDTVMYTVAGRNDVERGWGLVDETWQAMASLRTFSEAAGRPDIGWFNLGDRDLGTHLYRTSRLAEGARLSEVTAEMASALELPIQVIPATDDRVRTRLSTSIGDLTFQEYFVREHHSVEVAALEFEGAAAATPSPGVLDALSESDVIVIAPSNPLISIGPILSVPGIRDAIEQRRHRTVAISPIIGGQALKGPADRLLSELGHASTATAVAGLYQPLCASFVIDTVDAHLAPLIEELGMTCPVCPSIMVDLEISASLARTSIESVFPEPHSAEPDRADPDGAAS